MRLWSDNLKLGKGSAFVKRDLRLLPLTEAEFEADFWFDAESSTKRREVWTGMVLERESGAVLAMRDVQWPPPTVVNFLDDSSRKPHLKPPFIDKAFGVAESTGQGKSMLIRRMLKIGTFDPKWTLPSRLHDNPRVWMVSVNGFGMDMRFAPRELQVEAFEKGLIPYIPADRGNDSDEDE